MLTIDKEKAQVARKRLLQEKKEREESLTRALEAKREFEQRHL